MSEEQTQAVINRVSAKSTNVSFFKDDTIEVVRNKIGIAVGMHPDYLRIYVATELPGDYYESDPRKRASLFVRMSVTGKAIAPATLRAYNTSRDLPLSFPEGAVEQAEWNDLGLRVDAPFQELRILGVPEDSSWVFPLDNTTEPAVLPQPAQAPFPEGRRIFQNLHPTGKGFVVIPYQDTLKPTLQVQYYPTLRPGTPAQVREDVARALATETQLINTLYGLQVQQPKTPRILRARWRIPLVDTDFGDAPRNRFEQILFGTTLSEKTPSMSLFTSRREQSQHKFYSEDTVNKKPSADLRVWAHWWTVSKPTRSRPTLIVFRGDNRQDFDRVAFTSQDIVISAHRDAESKDTLEDIQTSITEWISGLDGLEPFLVASDLKRWELQDVSAQLAYETSLDEADFRRFDCLRSIFDIANKESLAFRFLRADGFDTGLSPNEVRGLQMIRDDPVVRVEDVSEELSITLKEAEVLLNSLKAKLDTDRDLLVKVTQSLPLFRFSAKTVTIVSTTDLPQITRYISLLRHALKNPDDEALDDVCPKRVEVMEPAVTIVAANETPVELEGSDYLDALLEDVGNVQVVAAPTPVPTVSKPAPAKVKAKGVPSSLYNYFNRRLQEFDPLTFADYSKKCEPKRQPVVMSESELSDNPALDPRETTEDVKILETKDPNGVFLCPEYWCVIDKIPLTEAQLDAGKCPVCGGKVRDPKSKEPVSEYSVLKRDATYPYPGYLKPLASNGKQMPCCFKGPQKTRVSQMKEVAVPSSKIELFYVLGENKTRLPALRVAYIDEQVGKALRVPLKYEAIQSDGNRIQAGAGAIFRVGMGHPADTLHKVLNVPEAKKPAENVQAVLQCSFFRNWRGLSDSAPESILTQIPAGMKAREQLAKMVASIDEAYVSRKLAPMDELEYVSLALDCDAFRVYSDPVRVGCLMMRGMVKNVRRSICVLVNSADPESIDYIAFVSRTGSSDTPQMSANLYSDVLQTNAPQTLDVLNTFRNQACTSTPLPTFDRASSSLSKLGTPTSIVLDPYGRAQAIFSPKNFLVPFRPQTLAVTDYPMIPGYADIPQDELPTKASQLAMLEKMVKLHKGYTYSEDLLDTNGKVREILTESGLRIPIQPEEPEKLSDPSEVTATVREHTEEKLVFGSPNEEDSKIAANIRYESEVFNFLIFQLSEDIQKEDYADLREALTTQNKDQIKKLLIDWFDTTVRFFDVAEPPSFVSKIRTPCSGKRKADCKSNLCAWVGRSCRVRVNTTKESLKPEPLYKRLLSTLLSNDKIRAIVTEHRASPFFATVLYMEMPHELLLSDADLKNIPRSE
jgi:hypothetical protein